jgi:hypothetical protein
MDIQQQLTFELQRRVNLLPQEVNELKLMTDKNIEGMGIHQSQISTIKMTLDELLGQQAEAITGLSPKMPVADFADKRGEIEDILTATHSIMATFRYIFDQRNESTHYKSILDMADLVAANCYLPPIKLSNRWREKPADHFREPPLTYLNAMLSPAALTRRHTIKKVGLQPAAGLQKQLPISIISLPFHDTVAVWTLCSLYHEVGHLLDNDIGLQAELSEKITGELQKKSATAERIANWQFWVEEMIADTFGVLLGGAAFAYAIANLLFRPSNDIKVVSDDHHPNEYVRIYIVGALLKHTGIKAFAEAATQIEDMWHKIYGDIAELSGYLPECEVVAKCLLNAKMKALNDHALIELSPGLKGDHEKIDELATWLRDDFARPEPKNYTFRLVPAAAQLALTGVTDDFEHQYEAIHQRALEFASDIERPKFLDPTGISPARMDYLKGLAKKINLKALNVDSH